MKQTLKVRQELARFNKIRPCNVCMIDVIIETIKAIFKGLMK